jgi:GNAT superfamily N-acetyltransferase
MLEERIKVGQVDRLDAFHARELGCGVELLRSPGVHVFQSDRRSRPSWGGYTVPVFGLSTSQGGLVSCRADLLDEVRQELQPAGRDQPISEAAFERLRRITRKVVPYAYSLSGYTLYCERSGFRPLPGPAERLASTDRRGIDLRRRFDGEIFVVSGARGEIASWAALKLKADDVWELAVVTEPAYRGRGYAKLVVSAATAYTLEMGRLPIYVHDRTNHASAKVCRSLGYVEYAEEYFCEY